MLKDTLNNNENVTPNSKEMEILKANFPQCFDSAGVFDIKLFEEFVKAKDINIKKEGYSLNFLGKSYARYLSNLDSETVIVPDESNKDNPSENIYIVGDNLDALQHLKHSYTGAIKCIYIDPPYNTGTDGFVYNDKFEFTVEELTKIIGIEDDEARRILNMQGKSTLSAWLTFMYPRLELARSLLSEDGVIFISIDDNEQANCKLLCDAVFGEGNFIACIIVENDSRVRSYDALATTHEYIFLYRKTERYHSNVLLDPDKKFQFKDELGGFDLYELRNRNSDFNINNRPNLYYPFWVNPDNEDQFGLHELSLEEKSGWIKFYPQESQGIKTVWRWGKEKSAKNLNKVIFGKLATGGWQVVKKYRV